MRLIPFFFIIFSLYRPTTQTELATQDVNALSEFLKKMTVNSMHAKMNPITALIFKNLLKEFNINPDQKIPSFVDQNKYIIPKQLRNNPKYLKNPGVIVNLTVDTILKSLLNIFPKVQKVFSNTKIPFNVIYGPLLIKSINFQIPQQVGTDWIRVKTEPRSNAIQIEITNFRLTIALRTFLSLAVAGYEGNVYVDTVLNKLKITITFTGDEHLYYVKPKIFGVVPKFEINDTLLNVRSDFKNAPLDFSTLIIGLFKTQIKNSVEYYVKQTIHKDLTQQTNALTQKFYRDAFVIEEHLAVNALMTSQPIVLENQIQLNLVGQFFDPTKPYTVYDNPDPTENIFKDNMGIQLILAQSTMNSFIHGFFKNYQDIFIPHKVLNYPINAMVGVKQATVEVVNDQISLKNLPIGVFCDANNGWACMETLKVSLGVNIASYTPKNGNLYIVNTQPTIENSAMLDMIGGKTKGQFYLSIINSFLSGFEIGMLKTMPPPLPDFLNLDVLFFMYFDGYFFLETQVELLSLDFI